MNHPGSLLLRSCASIICYLIAVLSAVTVAAEAFAQGDSRAPTIMELQGKDTSMELPSGSASGAKSSAGGRSQPSRNWPTAPGLSVIEKPAGAQALRFTTQVETKIENKTTNHVGGNGGVGAPGLPPEATQPIPGDGDGKLVWRSDFEALVQQTFGRSLPLFGENFFAQTDSYRPSEALGVPAGYLVGPGDEITTRAWGEIEIDHMGSVDRQGNLFIPKVGSLAVAGVPYGQLTEFIRKAISTSYKSFQLSVSLNTTRTVLVQAVGLAKRPGSHQISAYSKFIDAIFAVGGPAPKANYRRILLLRDGRKIAEVDLYSFMSTGRDANSLQILANDVIVFESTSKVAAVVGQVVSPAMFQLKENSSIEELIRLAGGFNAGANPSRILLERTDENQNRISQWITVSSNLATHVVQSGDIYNVLPMSPKIKNSVSLQGQVAVPLRQPWVSGMKVSDLIPSPEFLVNPTTWLRQNERTTPDKIASNLGKLESKPSGPNIHWEYAVIERINRLEQTTTLVPFNLRRAIVDRHPEHDLPLIEGDIVTVFSKESMRVSSSQKVRHVRVEGEVGAAGVYPVNEGETLIDVIRRAGSLTVDAFVYGAELNRESVRDLQQQRMTDAIDRLEQDMQRALSHRLRNAISSDDAGSSPFEAESIKSLISKLRAFKPTGRIVLGLQSSNVSLSDLPNLRLEDSDSIFIPKRPAVVTVLGAVVQGGSFIYSEQKRLSYYMALAGDVSRFGDRSRVYVVRADGSILSAGQTTVPIFGVAIFTQDPLLEPGDTVIVPEKVDSITVAKSLRDWTQILYQFGLGAAGLKILKSN